MDKFKKSQILKLFLIAALLIVTPLLSTSARSTYLYFIVNILIIVVGAEAGLLSFFLDSPENKKRAAAALKPVIFSGFSPNDHKGKAAAQFGKNGTSTSPDKVVEKHCSGEQKVKKSPSTSSIFFIGGGDAEGFVEEINDDDDDDDEGEGEGQELFHKAETFIGNFYKQLKMQRKSRGRNFMIFIKKPFN